MSKRSITLLISAILSLLWMVFSSFSYFGALYEGIGSDAARSIGTLIGAALLLPCMIVAWIGTIFNCVGWAINKKGFALVAAILFCVSLILGITYSFGLVPSIVLSFIAYARMKRDEEANQIPTLIYYENFPHN